MRLYFFYLALVVFVVSSCTRVIDLELNDAAVKYVVEGIITNEPGTCKVILTKSKNFNEDNVFEKVSGAQVTVIDNGNSVLLQESSAGVYETNAVNGIPGRTYSLSIAVDGKLFTANSTMPQPVLMDSLYISKGPFGQFKFATIAYSDPPALNNGYRFIQYVNDVKEPAIFWDNDEFTDGQTTTFQLDVSADDEDDPRNIKAGDSVTVEMLCLDEPIYRYWYVMRSSGGSGNANTAAPANPATNISGGALGYFSAHTISRKTVIAP